MVSTVCLDVCLRSVNITGHGTALLNESAGLCADFAKHYRGFIVKDLDASSYPKKLLLSVKVCNAQLV